MHPRIIWAIVRKDLGDAIKNMYLLFAIVLPIGMSLLFRVLFPSESSGGGGFLDIAVYDSGQSRLVQALMETKQFSMYIVESPDEVKKRVEKDLLGGLVIPANFDAEIAAGKMPELVVYLNTKRAGMRQIAFRQTVEGSLREMAGQTMPARVRVSDLSGVSDAAFNLSNFYLQLFLLMSLTMVGVFVVPYMLVEEKEKQTLKAVLVSPASYADVVIGKGLVGVFYALLVTIILMALNNGFAGNVIVVLLALILGSVFLVLLGLLMGAMFKNISQVNSWSSIVMLALLLPGLFGVFLSPPEPIPTIMRFIPTSYIGTAVARGMADTITVSAAIVNLGVLAAAAALAFGSVIWFLRRERQ